MPQREYESAKLGARQYADEQLGSYLMKIGKFDLRDLSPIEVDRMITVILQGYADAMEKHMEAPF